MWSLKMRLWVWGFMVYSRDLEVEGLQVSGNFRVKGVIMGTTFFEVITLNLKT